MSRFDNLFGRTGAPLLQQQLGRPTAIFYEGPGVSGRLPLRRAIVGAEEIDTQETFDGRRRERVREVTVRRAAGLPFWADPPSIEGTFIVDEIEYAVDELGAVTATFARVRLIRRGSVEHSRPGYRKQT